MAQQLDSGSLGALIGTFTTNIVQADSAAKQACLERDLAAFDAGNFDWHSEMSLIGMEDNPLKLQMSVPKAICLPLQPVEISRAYLEIFMYVSSHTEEKTTTDIKTEVQGKASIGLGLWKASMSVKASMGQHHENQRSSDNRSSCKAIVEMGQGETPEGISRLLDAQYTLVDKGMDINMAVMEIKKEELRAKYQAANTGGDYSDSYDDSGGDDYPDDSGGDDDYTDADSGGADDSTDDLDSNGDV